MSNAGRVSRLAGQSISDTNITTIIHLATFVNYRHISRARDGWLCPLEQETGTGQGTEGGGDVAGEVSSASSCLSLVT